MLPFFLLTIHLVAHPYTESSSFVTPKNCSFASKALCRSSSSTQLSSLPLLSFMHYDNASKVGHGKSLMRAVAATSRRLCVAPPSFPFPQEINSLGQERSYGAGLPVASTSTSSCPCGRFSRRQSERFRDRSAFYAER